MNHFDQLPDLCLLNIFERVPLNDLVTQVPLTCRRWYKLVKPSALARRRQLILIAHSTNGKDSLKRWQEYAPWSKPVFTDSSILYCHDNILSNFYSKWINNSLNKLTSLCIHYDYYEQQVVWPFTMCLLIRFGRHLVTLHLYFMPPGQCLDPQLFNVINQWLPQLRDLHFRCDATVTSELVPLPPYFTLPIVRQLHRFVYHHWGPSFMEVHRAVLCHLERCDERLVRCVLDLVTPREGDLLYNVCQRLAQFKPEIARRITELNDLIFITDRSSLKFLISRFTSLRTLEFCCPNPPIPIDISLAEVLNYANMLPNLENLSLDAMQPDFFRDFRFDQQFANVRKVSGGGMYESHEQLLATLNFRRIFPRLERTSFYSSSDSVHCSVCQEFGAGFQSDECLQRFKQTFIAAGCTNVELKYYHRLVNCQW